MSWFCAMLLMLLLAFNAPLVCPLKTSAFIAVQPDNDDRVL